MTGIVSDLLTPTEAEIAQAKVSSHQLARLLPQLQDKLTLHTQDAQGLTQELQLPASALKFLQ